jgi:hypothetical protein
MLYNILKILHVLSAALFLTGIGASIYIWKTSLNSSECSINIQKYTLIVISFALLQLLSGFTMISLKHYDISQLWITGSALCFTLVITSWFAFLYFAAFKRLQTVLLGICLSSILSMVFLMANKIP